MKTYKKTIETPRLEIEHDVFADNPRKLNENLGYFITCELKYVSPDEKHDLKRIIKETSEEAKDSKDHEKKIIKAMKEEGLGEVIAIYPINRYEHGGVIYSIGENHGFDYSNCGFYIVTKETADNLGVDKKHFKEIIEKELDEYNRYANGEVYCFTLYDEDGEVMDGGGNYTLEDIKEGLPEEFKEEDIYEYMKNIN